MGWEPVWHHTYDDAGRLVSSQPEPEWDDMQREGALGLQQYREAERCPTCGGPKWQCQSAEAENAWEASLPTRCHITTAVRIAQEQFGKSNPSSHPEALSWGARRRASTALS